ncbi:HTH domain-containing protein [Periweissella cryptocerci]|uniref:HTH domain-containing protein n=1 Tax=Periweissella cryptocerci TaxID=2506420 RepID=A0A4P6YSQ4_9LACO|nr:helix-turn-helix domain-containing protein [Periweissella cryptocerci]QBO35701.1 HTH domain-containing protein [Periweissella cryptocerci]
MLNQLLSKQHKRQFEIVNMLMSSATPTTTEFANQLKTTRQTIQTDIDELNAVITPHIIVQVDNQWQLIASAKLSLTSIHSQILSQSLSFNILETIFLGNVTTQQELLESALTSQATLYREIKNINAILNPLNIHLNTRKLIIEGDEFKVRSFFFQYFFEKYEFASVFVPDIELETFDKLITTFSKNNNVYFNQADLSFMEYNKLCILLKVSIQRLQQGYHIDLPGQATFTVDLDANLEREFFYNFKIPLSAKTYSEIFGLFYNQYYVVTIDALNHLCNIDAKYATLVDSIKQLISFVAEQPNIELTNQDDLLIALFNAVQAKDFIQFILLDKIGQFIATAQFENHRLFTDIVVKITELIAPGDCEESQLVGSLMYELIINCDSLYHELKHVTELQNLHIGFILNLPTNHINLLISDLQAMLPDAKLTVLNNLSLPALIKESAEFDVVVSNLHGLASQIHAPLLSLTTVYQFLNQSISESIFNA